MHNFKTGQKVQINKTHTREIHLSKGTVINPPKVVTRYGGDITTITDIFHEAGQDIIQTPMGLFSPEEIQPIDE